MTRRATSCNDRSNFMRHRVRKRASEWKRLGASEQVLGWIRHGVRIPFIGGRRPPPFNSGTSMLNATKQQLDFMDSELPRFLQSGAWEPGQRSRWVSRMFLVPKPGENKWRLIIDLRPLNKYCKDHKLTYETLKLQEPDAGRRLDGVLRPRGRLLQTRHTGGGQRLLHG